MNLLDRESVKFAAIGTTKLLRLYAAFGTTYNCLANHGNYAVITNAKSINFVATGTTGKTRFYSASIGTR